MSRTYWPDSAIVVVAIRARWAALLEIEPGAVSPVITALEERFGTQQPCAPAASLNAAGGTTLTHDTVRRRTEQAGAVWRRWELAVADTLETAEITPDSPAGDLPDPDPVVTGHAVPLSLDGAMVPRIG